MTRRTTGAHRILELDSLRGIAAIAVVLFHYSFFYKTYLNSSDPIPGFHFIWGELGVDLFFMLSGFVIMLTAERNQSAIEFGIGRFVRLWPTFFICCALTTIFLILFPIGPPITLSTFLINLTLQPGLVKTVPIDGVYWSLHVEVQFYMIFAIIIGLNQVKRAVNWFSLFTICCIIYQLLLIIHGSDNFVHYYIGLIRHAHIFLSGIFCYRFFQTKNFRYIFYIALASVGVLTSHWMRHYTFDMLTHYISYWVFIILILYSAIIGGRFLKNSVLQFSGKISYALYLLHMMIGFTLLHQFEKIGIAPKFGVGIVIILVILLSSLVTFFVDIPLRKPLKSLLTQYAGKVRIVHSKV